MRDSGLPGKTVLLVGTLLGLSMNSKGRRLDVVHLIAGVFYLYSLAVRSLYNCIHVTLVD